MVHWALLWGAYERISQDAGAVKTKWQVLPRLVAQSLLCNNKSLTEHRTMLCRGIRGATVAASNTKKDILVATRELLQKMIESNQVEKEAVACVFFTMTADLDAEFPALAARQLGWTQEALVGCQEADITDVMRRLDQSRLKGHLSRGVERTVIGVVGVTVAVLELRERIELMPGVEEVVPISKPFKLSSREFEPEDTVIRVGDVEIGGNTLVGMAGPWAGEP